MQAYEFSTKIGPGGKLMIPATHTDALPVGESVRVIVLVTGPDASVPNETQPPDLLAQIVAEIQFTPQNPAQIQPASGLLAEHLANAPHEFDPSFDESLWNQEWDRVEEEMNAIEIADELAEMRIQDR